MTTFSTQQPHQMTFWCFNSLSHEGIVGYMVPHDYGEYQVVK